MTSIRGRAARPLVAVAMCAGALVMTTTFLTFTLPPSSADSRQPASRSPERQQSDQSSAGRRSLLLGGASFLAAPQAAQAKLGADELKRSLVFKQAAPSITGITTKEVNGKGQAPPYLGSGFVWDKQHVVTNFHVIAD